MAEYKVVDTEQLNADLSSVAEAIRAKGDTTESLEFPQGFVDGIGAIESGGGTEEIEQIIDNSGVLDSTDGTATEKVEQLIDFAEWRKYIQDRIYYCVNQRLNLFNGMPLESKKINEFDFSKNTNFGDAFSQNKGITELNIDTNSATALNHLVSYCDNLEKVVLTTTKNVTNFNTSFGHNPKLKHVETLDFSGATSGTLNPFYNSYAIETIKIVAESIHTSIRIESPVLSDGANGTFNTIQSIIDGLAYVETAQTLILNATVKEKLTEEQLATITSKNWNLA